MHKYINFDSMITPTIIKILFWVGVGLSGLFGIITFFSGLAVMFTESGFTGFLMVIFSLIIIAVGILVSRIYCELLIVVFKMHESLTQINEKLDKLD